MPVPRGLPLGSKITVRPGEDSFVLHRAVRIVGQLFGRGNHFCRLDGYYEDSFSTKWYPEVELCRSPPIRVAPGESHYQNAAGATLILPCRQGSSDLAVVSGLRYTEATAHANPGAFHLAAFSLRTRLTRDFLRQRSKNDFRVAGILV